MPKFLTKHFTFTDPSERKEGDSLQFSCDVQISSKGHFYTYLPIGITEAFEQVGIKTTFNYKTNKPGFVEADTFAGLEAIIETYGKEYISKEIISQTVKIEYSIETSCHYVLDENGCFGPNGYYVSDKTRTDSYWREGTIKSFASDAVVYGLQIYAKPFVETVYQYKSGKIYQKKEFNSSRFTEGLKLGENGKWLQAIVRQRKPTDGKIQEVEYDEQVAGFFRSFFESLFQMNEKIKGNFTPENVKQIAASRNASKFLTGGTE